MSILIKHLASPMYADSWDNVKLRVVVMPALFLWGTCCLYFVLFLFSVVLPCTVRKGSKEIHKTIANVGFLAGPHDDVIKWKHFPRYWSFVRGIRKGQWRGALMFSLICVWINGWVSNREAGDLRRYRTHYDATVMITHHKSYNSLNRCPGRAF